MPDATLFHGIAVVIDDEINDPGSGIRAIQTQIETENCFVIGLTDIPDDPAKLGNLRAASFFVVDWNLNAVPLGEGLGAGAAFIPSELKKANAIRVIDFLKKLKDVRFAPVFIFTGGSVDEVETFLKKYPDLWDDKNPSHIFVKTKAEVRERGVFNVLADALRETPSAYVLKVWERQYDQAKNELFLDFYTNSVVWPLILWKTFEDDGVPPSVELGNLIGRNLLSRMTPFKFDLSSFGGELLKNLEADQENYRQTLVKVLEGEIFLPLHRLHSDSIAPGDVFKDGKHYLVNIRPDCDCIARSGEAQDSIELYLLEGSKLSSGQVNYDSDHGLIRERDTETIIFPINNGSTVSFRFKTLLVRTWGDYKAKRIGRLLPPFLTRLQQRYSAYSQRPGLTRVPKAALGLLPDSQIGEEEKPTHAASVEDTGRVTTGVAPGRFVGFVECLKRLFKN
jgi:hypothetical protein